MRVGINGMGRIGRLTLRAAMGGLYRAPDDPRADNRLDVVHVNEFKGGAATTSHLIMDLPAVPLGAESFGGGLAATGITVQGSLTGQNLIQGSSYVVDFDTNGHTAPASSGSLRARARALANVSAARSSSRFPSTVTVKTGRGRRCLDMKLLYVAQRATMDRCLVPRTSTYSPASSRMMMSHGHSET